MKKKYIKLSLLLIFSIGWLLLIFFPITQPEKVNKNVNVTLPQYDQRIDSKESDDSKTIEHLSNAIYIVTAIILVVTALIILFSLAPPFLMYSVSKKQAELNESIAENRKLIDEIKVELQNNIQKMESKVFQELRDEFREELISQLKRKLNKYIKYHNNLMQSQINQQSGEHEECLYYIEQVHLDFLSKDKAVESWMIRQQEDYFALLQLISPDPKDAYTALGIFKGRDNLPRSFLSLLRFLNEKGRLPDDDCYITADEIAREKFGEPLEK